MATITLEYDARNHTAEKILSVVLAMDNLFKVKSSRTKTVTAKKTGLEFALEDVENGRVFTAINAKSLIGSCLQ